MRKLYAFLLASFLVIIGTESRAQVSNYVFSQNNGTYTEISGGTQLGIATGNTSGTSIDDAIFNIPAASFPFTFTYNGIGYTGCNVSTNGFITFGATAPGTTLYTPISGATAYDGAIAAFGKDINSFFNVAGQTGDLRWETVGIAPNRQVVIQWRKYRPSFSTSTTEVFSMNFQVRLSEGSNMVSVVYGPSQYFAGGAAISTTCQVGLRGATNADFNNRTSTTTWYNTTRGTLNTNTVSFNSLTNLPVNGLTYMWIPAASACAGTPTAGSISGTTGFCSGTLNTLTLNGYTFPQSGITIQWKSATVSGGPYTNITGATSNQYTFTPATTGTTYYVATVTCANGGGNATTAEFTQVVIGATIGVGPTPSLTCAGDPVVLTATGGVTYTWAPATGLSATTGTSVTASPVVTTTYTVTGTAANGCTNTAAAVINVKPATIVSVLPTSNSVCAGTPTNLNASATPQPYGVSSIAFSPVPTPGGGVTTLCNGGVTIVPVSASTFGPLDDVRWDNIVLPFTFTLYGTNYTNVNICSNGWIGMGATNTSTSGYANGAFPNAAAPNAAVFPFLADIDFSATGVIQYFTVGSFPNRQFVVNFSGFGFFSGGGTGNVQAILYETSNIVEFHLTSSTNTTSNKSQAIENSTGTVALTVPSRNNVTTFTGAPDAWRFTPGSINYTWSPAAGLNMTTGPSVIATPVSTTVYTVTATDASTGCSGTATSTITVTTAAITTIAYGQTLFGAMNGGELMKINTTTGAGAAAGNIDVLTQGSTDIEYDHTTGNAYTQVRDGGFLISPFNISAGTVSGPPVADGFSFQGLEYIGGQLYGTSIPFQFLPSSLQKLDPVTGVATMVGPTGLGNPISGIAYDIPTGILYGIGGGPGISGFYTINILTGAATLVGASGIQAGSLQFGPDGRLYAGGVGATNGGKIYTIDKATGIATLLGPTGLVGGNNNGITGLTLANIPAVFCKTQGPVAVTRLGTPGGTFSAAPAGLTIDATTGTITPGTSTAGNYIVTLTFTASGSCPAFATKAPVTINATPDVNAVSNQTLCVGQSTVAVNFSGAVGGTVFNWTNNQTSIGLAASGSGNIAPFVTTNVTSSVVVATITVTPTYTNAGVTCTGTPITFTITVNPANAITSQPVNRVICSNQSTTFVVASTVTSPATTYQWQINQGSGFVNIAPVLPFSGVTSNTLTVTTPSTIYSGNTFQVIVTGPCGGPLTSNVVTLTVNPIPTITVAPSGVCGPVTLTAQGNSNTYAWAPALGLNTTSGAVVIASPVVTTTYTVTGTFTGTGCQNTATSTVLGTPPVPVITPPSATICAGQFQQLSAANGLTGTFNSASAVVNIPAAGTGTGAGSPASVYGIPVVVSGLPTTGVTIKSVTVNGITHTWPQDLDMLLQSPGAGTNIILMSDVSGIFPGVSGVNYTFDDAAAGPVPGGANAPTGTYKPTNAVGGIGNEPDNFPAPGPGVIAQPTPTLSMFSGNPNGTWNLFVSDDGGGDIGTLTGWSISFNVATITWTPATGLYLTPNTSQPYVLGTPANVVYASPAGTTTYTAINTFSTCVSGPAQATVTVNPVPVVTVLPNNQCTPVSLTATSTINPATFAWTPAAGLSATTGANVTATPNVTTTYTVVGTVTATGCQGTASAVVNPTPGAPTITPSSATICQGTPVKLTATPGVGSAAATASSGAINVAIPDGSFTGATNGLNIAGIPANVQVDSVKVNFTLEHTFDLDMIINLKAPNGNVLNLVYTEGLDGDNFTNTSITSAALTPLAAGTAPFTGTFAADRNIGPGPTGSAANVANWSDLYSTLNGTWTLAMMDQLAADVGTLKSWSVTIYYKNAVTWTPITGLFTNSGATTAYVAGTPLNEVYANPATTTTYTAGSTLGPCTGPTTNVVVTVVNTISVTTHPANQTVCANTNATFSVVATGNFLSYQWQVSVAAGPFNDIPGQTGTSLTLNAVTVGMSGNQYRVRIFNSCFSATSNAATLTVNALPVVSITTVMPSRICLSDTLIPLLGTPVGGVWSGVGVSNANFIPSATAVGTFTLTYSYSNINNCVNTATIVAKVQDCPERVRELDNDALSLYPNPNDGQFNVRVNSQLYSQLFMSVYTAGGQLVRRTELKGLVYGRVITFDFKNLPAGTYMVRFVNVGGVRTSQKTFTVVIAQH